MTKRANFPNISKPPAAEEVSAACDQNAEPGTRLLIAVAPAHRDLENIVLFFPDTKKDACI